MLFQVPHRQGFWRDEDGQGVLGFSLEGSMRMSTKERKAFSVAGKKQIWWDRSRELTRDNPRWDLVADIVILRASEIYWLCHNFRETLSDYVSEKIKNKKKKKQLTAIACWKGWNMQTKAQDDCGVGEQRVTETWTPGRRSRRRSGKTNRVRRRKR